jgi:hypothetical protein
MHGSASRLDQTSPAARERTASVLALFLHTKLFHRKVVARGRRK